MSQHVCDSQMSLRDQLALCVWKYWFGGLQQLQCLHQGRQAQMIVERQFQLAWL